MVWYYCEICNRNVNIGQNKKPICPKCFLLLKTHNLTPEEIKKRRKERLSYCKTCKKMIYSVSKQLLFDSLGQRESYKNQKLRRKKI